jgi:acetoin utilization protein AcuB
MPTNNGKDQLAMFVKERMSHPVITIHQDLAIQDALAMMKEESIRRLPVVDKKGKLVGIVTEQDLLQASPSDATSLSIWELNYLISKITVSEIMNKDVVTIEENTPVEEAARIMTDNKIGGLPVMKDDEMVGIITETDLFKLFLELLGAREQGVRVTALIKDQPGELEKITRAIHAGDGNIVAIVQALGHSSENRVITMKVQGMDLETIKKAVEPEVQELIDIR